MHKLDIVVFTLPEQKVLLFIETVLNIIRNLIPRETVIFDDMDTPWITSCIKKAI